MSAAEHSSPADPGGGDSISRNAVLAFVTQMSSAAFTAALTVFLTRTLGPAGFGLFALALSVTGLVARPAGGGTTQAAGRYVAERYGDTAAIAGVLGMALRTRLLTASVVAVALIALAEPIAALYDEPDLAEPLRWVAIAFFGQSIMRFGHTIFVSLRRASGGLIVVATEAAMEFTATIGFVLLIGGAASAAAGRAAGYVIGAVFAIALLTRSLGRSPLFRTGPSPIRRRDFMGYASAMLVMIVASAAFSQLGVLLLGALLTTTAVGVYAAPLRLVGLASYPGLALAQGVAPRLARGGTSGPPNVRALSLAFSRLILLQLGVATVLLVWADPIVEFLLGSQYAESAEVLRALAPFIFLSGLNPLLVSPLNYAGEGRSRIPIAVATLIATAGVDLILIPEIGTVGAAIGTDIGYAIYVGGHLWLAHRVLGLPLAPIASGLARGAAAAAALGAVLLLAGTHDLSLLAWIAGSIAGGATFLGALLMTRALSLAELRRAASLVRRALRPG